MSQGGVELDTSVGYLLKQAASALRSGLDEVLRPLGMTVPQYASLELLAQRPGLSNSELARGAFVTRQSMNVLLQSLERDGLVSREGPSEGRARPIILTEQGRRRLASASAAVQSVEGRMVARLEEGERERLRALLVVAVEGLAGG